MYKIATVTFHRAHNFGSVLQTYALQTYVQRIFEKQGQIVDYKIVDFYPEKQKEFYRIFKKERNIKNLVKNIMALPYKKKLEEKYSKFERFMEKNYNLTDQYKTEKELFENKPEVDCYISGSDQLWNVRSLDFSDIYYLSFAGEEKKISYAASFGPLKIDWKNYREEKYKKLLKKYECISVREKGSQKNVEYLTDESCSVNVDPTLLLSAEEWRRIQSTANYKNGQYILLYCLEPTKKQIKMAKMISKKLKLPIVVLRYNNKNDIINSFVKRYDSGPEDFLAYVDHAALVLSSSFHGTAFSMIYDKAFYVFDGKKDNRIFSLLSKMDMQDRSIETFDEIERVNLKKPSKEKIKKVLSEEEKASRTYLQKAFGLED